MVPKSVRVPECATAVLSRLVGIFGCGRRPAIGGHAGFHGRQGRCFVEKSGSAALRGKAATRALRFPEVSGKGIDIRIEMLAFGTRTI